MPPVGTNWSSAKFARVRPGAVHYSTQWLLARLWLAPQVR